MNLQKLIEEMVGSEVPIEQRRLKPTDYIYSIKDGNGKLPYRVVGYNNALFLANDMLSRGRERSGGYAVIENEETGEYEVIA